MPINIPNERQVLQEISNRGHLSITPTVERAVRETFSVLELNSVRSIVQMAEDIIQRDQDAVNPNRLDAESRAHFDLFVQLPLEGSVGQGMEREITRYVNNCYANSSNPGLLPDPMRWRDVIWSYLETQYGFARPSIPRPDNFIIDDLLPDIAEVEDDEEREDEEEEGVFR